MSLKYRQRKTVKRIIILILITLSSLNAETKDYKFNTHIIPLEEGNRLIDNFFEKELVITFKKKGFSGLNIQKGETLFIEPCVIFPQGEFTLKVREISENGDFFHVKVDRMDFVERNEYLNWLRK